MTGNEGWKRFGNYMPMLATVAVVGCVAIALKGYAAPVYGVEQPETFQSAEADAKEKKQETEETEQAKKGNFDLADGFIKAVVPALQGLSLSLWKLRIKVLWQSISSVHRMTKRFLIEQRVLLIRSLPGRHWM